MAYLMEKRICSTLAAVFATAGFFRPPFPRLGKRTAQCRAPCLAFAPGGAGLLVEKEVIQPQVPLRLPCYDFIPVTGTCLDALRRLR